jgi:preprotein translocase subunit SecF
MEVLRDFCTRETFLRSVPALLTAHSLTQATHVSLELSGTARKAIFVATITFCIGIIIYITLYITIG